MTINYEAPPAASAVVAADAAVAAASAVDVGEGAPPRTPESNRKRVKGSWLDYCTTPTAFPHRWEDFSSPLVKNSTATKIPWYSVTYEKIRDEISSAKKLRRLSFENNGLPVTNETRDPGAGDNPASGLSSGAGEARILALEQEMRLMKHEMIEMKRVLDSRHFATNMALARDREELDYLGNKNKEHRIFVTGISSDTDPPRDKIKKVDWIRHVVTSLFDMLKPGVQRNIKGIWQKPGPGGLPAAEVIMVSSELAMEIRTNFATKKKQGIDFGEIFLQNVVTVATKVRIAIMQAIVDKFKTDNLVMYVRHFSSRPILLIKKLDGANVEETGLTFVDAIKRFGRELKSDDLDTAYSRAGRSFTGQMPQTFVVLHESLTDTRVNAARVKLVKRKEAAVEELKKRNETKSGAGLKFRSGFGSGRKEK